MVMDHSKRFLSIACELGQQGRLCKEDEAAAQDKGHRNAACTTRCSATALQHALQHHRTPRTLYLLSAPAPNVMRASQRPLACRLTPR